MSKQIKFLGDFYFSYDDAETYNTNVERIEELMWLHCELYKNFKQEEQYVTSGSILWCDGGSKLTKFDIPVGHAVDKNGQEVGICSDCKDNHNIYSFGGCRFPTPEGYPKRKTIIVDATSSRIYEREMCIPVLAQNWQSTGKKNLKIWDYTDKQYHDVITTWDFLTCFYGGKIIVVEVNKGTEITEDKYYALERIKIRSSPNGPQIEDKAFIPGAIVKICKPLTQKEQDGYNWVKVTYDGDSNNEGWVAFEYLGKLPEPIKGHVFKYKWSNSQYVTQDFLDKAAGVSKALGIDPDDLMAVMAFESYLNPAQKNLAGGSATGLVQFMPDVATEINTTTSDLAKMSGVEQLDYVFGYMYGKKGIKTLGDIYMRVLCPEAIGEADNYPIYTKVEQPDKYEANKGLDADGNKEISKKEATKKVEDNRDQYYK